jgi:hypothetical protein
MYEKKTPTDPVDELQSFYKVFKENINILENTKEINGINSVLKEINGINSVLNEIKDLLSGMRDENSYKHNYLMVRLKKETYIGYQAIEKLIGMNIIHYDGSHFNFRCTFSGTIGSFFSYVGFTESKVLSEYVTHKGKQINHGTFKSSIKNTPNIKEWPIIKNILDNLI